MPVIDSPRIQRSDHKAEVTRRNNAAALVKAERIIFAGVSDDISDRFLPYFASGICYNLSEGSQIRKLKETNCRPSTLFHWGKDIIGIGLLKALQSNREIVFHDEISPNDPLEQKSSHLVVCEEGFELEQVICANYAYSINADLRLIPQTSAKYKDRVSESLYSVYENSQKSITEILNDLKIELSEKLLSIPRNRYKLITFISRPIPWGIAFPEVPTCHLFIYPDLGISIINGISSQLQTPSGIKIAAVVDPNTVKSDEVEIAAKCLANHKVFVRGFRGKNANVGDVSSMLQLLPYDFLLISTHCGDASGWRWTYEFIDSEGLKREFVVDVAIGVDRYPGQDELKVTQFEKFVSLDGVDWNDEQEKEKLYVGSAINDYYNLKNNIEPVKKEIVDRVQWSAALKMNDGNLLITPETFADNVCPIIFNNACVSWHQLAERFMFGSARAYIGTLFDVNSIEAQDVVLRFLQNHFNMPLAVALWQTQNEVYEGGERRPYIYVGTHFQMLKSGSIGTLDYYLKRLKSTRARRLKSKEKLTSTEHSKKNFESDIDFLNFEITAAEQNTNQQIRDKYKR